MIATMVTRKSKILIIMSVVIVITRKNKILITMSVVIVNLQG